MLPQWWHPVASSEVLDLLYQEMCAVLYRRIAMAIETASKRGLYCLIVVLLIVALEAAGAVRSEKLPYGGIQWLPG